jgi:hypothetical protein
MAMADEGDDVIIRIKVDGGPMPGGMLDQMMREQGVRVVSRSSAREERSWESAMEADAAITTLVVDSGRPAIKAAMTLFRKRFPKAKVETEDDKGRRSATCDSRPCGWGRLCLAARRPRCGTRAEGAPGLDLGL